MRIQLTLEPLNRCRGWRFGHLGGTGILRKIEVTVNGEQFTQALALNY